MTHWMCIKCGHYLKASQPPSHCPRCNSICTFNDVTCYRPDCGGEQNVDPLLVGTAIRTVSPKTVIPVKSEPSPSIMEGYPIIDILNGLTNEQKKKVKKLGFVKTYNKNEVICQEEKESRYIYLIREGQVSVESQLGVGMPIRTTTLNAGQYFGWSALVPPYKLIATVTAATMVKIFILDRTELIALMNEETGIGLKIMQNIASIISSRLHDLQQQMIILARQLGH
jgi:rubredoxin